MPQRLARNGAQFWAKLSIKSRLSYHKWILLAAVGRVAAYILGMDEPINEGKAQIGQYRSRFVGRCAAQGVKSHA